MDENNTSELTESTMFAMLLERLDRIANALECQCDRQDKMSKAVDTEEASLVVNNYPSDRWVGCNYERCPRAFWTPPEPGTLPWQKGEKTS